MYINNLDERLVNDASAILKEMGLDISTVTKMMLTRIVKEGSIGFMLANLNVQKTADTPVPSEPPARQIKMTKMRATSLLRNIGCEINGTVTFASKNKSTYNYWANPSISTAKQDWTLILNDWINRELHLFFIPANEIKQSDIKVRKDQPHLMDLQIIADDKYFTDLRSRISFKKFLLKTVTY